VHEECAPQPASSLPRFAAPRRSPPVRRALGDPFPTAITIMETAMPAEAEDVIVATVEKNSREAIRVALRSYRGRRFVDCRLYYDDKGELRPTGKGFGIAAALLPDLRAALDAAETAARAEGLIE